MLVETHLDDRDVVRVYRGRPGCMCGCRGTYATPTYATPPAHATDEPRSDRKVRNVVDDLNRAIALGADVDFNDDAAPFVAFEDDRRQIVAYLADDDRGRAIVRALRDSTEGVRASARAAAEAERQAARMAEYARRRDRAQASVDAIRERVNRDLARLAEAEAARDAIEPPR